MAIRNVWEDCRQAVYTTVVAMQLPARMPDSVTPSTGLLPVNLVTDLKKSFPLLTMPCVAVWTENLKDPDPDAKATTLVEVGYPVAVAFLDRAKAIAGARLSTYTDLYGQLCAAFRWQPLAGVSSVWQCRIETMQGVHSDPELYEYIDAGFVVRCLSREPVGGVPA